MRALALVSRCSADDARMIDLRFAITQLLSSLLEQICKVCHVVCSTTGHVKNLIRKGRMQKFKLDNKRKIDFRKRKNDWTKSKMATKGIKWLNDRKKK